MSYELPRQEPTLLFCLSKKVLGTWLEPNTQEQIRPAFVVENHRTRTAFRSPVWGWTLASARPSKLQSWSRHFFVFCLTRVTTLLVVVIGVLRQDELLLSICLNWNLPITAKRNNLLPGKCLAAHTVVGLADGLALKQFIAKAAKG